jgi:hypothetical protein
MNAAEYTRRAQWGAFEMLTKHELMDERYWDDGRGARWVLGEPGTFVGRTEIVAGIGGSLVVHGDFDLCRFGHYGDHGDAWSRLLWMADCTDLGYYIVQKASIGMAGRVDAMEYDAEVARDYLQAYVDGNVENGEGELREVLLEARDHCEHRDELRQFLAAEDKGWDLWELTPGEVPAWRVVVSHALLNKCAWLIREKWGSNGPTAFGAIP